MVASEPVAELEMEQAAAVVELVVAAVVELVAAAVVEQAAAVVVELVAAVVVAVPAEHTMKLAPATELEMLQLAAAVVAVVVDA
jgi:hypothetical protein